VPANILPDWVVTRIANRQIPGPAVEADASGENPEVASASWNKGGADGVLPDVTTQGPSGFREGDHRYQEYVC
jgi:hypothetical protein